MLRSLIILISLCAGLWAQDLAPDYKQSATLGKRYELLLSRQLSQYFQPGSFVVSAKVYLEEVLTPVEFENGAKVFDGQDALPGLPVLPKADSSQRYQDSLMVSRYRKDYELKYVDVNIIVDTRYSAQDISFIQDFVKMVANLDETRGDQVKVNRRPFPKSPNDPLLNPESPLRKVDSLPILNRDTSKANNIVPSIKNNEILWWQWLILAFGLFFILILIILLLRRKVSTDVSNPAQKDLDALRQQVQNLQNKADEPIVQIPPLPVDARSPEWKEGRNYLINQLVGHPRKSAQVFESWIQAKSTQGLGLATMALESLDYRLIRMFKNNMDAESLAKLELSLQTFVGAEESEKTNALSEFRKDFQNISGQSDDDRQSDLFHFLDLMTVHQLKHLVGDESPGIKAIVLAQVKPATAAQLLQDLDESEKAMVLVNMGQIQNITVRTYKEIADRLSDKALSLTDMRYVASDGVESVISLVMDLPVNAQGQYIQSIAEQDLELAQRIRFAYITFDEIVKVETKQMAGILDSFERDSLALALMRAEPEFVTKVLDLFTERSRMMLLSSMENQVEKTLDDVELARKQLLIHARKEFIRQGGVRR